MRSKPPIACLFIYTEFTAIGVAVNYDEVVALDYFSTSFAGEERSTWSYCFHKASNVSHFQRKTDMSDLIYQLIHYTPKCKILHAR